MAMICKIMLIMSIITEVRGGFKHLQNRSGNRGCLTMSVASGVIVGGGRIGSFLHETNGTADLFCWNCQIQNSFTEKI